MIFKEIDMLTFGKHKGKTVEWVRENDFDYLKHLSHSTDWFNLDNPIPMEYIFNVGDIITNGNKTLRVLSLRQGGGYKAEYIDSGTVTIVPLHHEKYYGEV